MNKLATIAGVAGVAVGVLIGAAAAGDADPQPVDSTVSTDACRQAVGLYQQEISVFAAEHGAFAVAAGQMSQTGDTTAFIIGLSSAAEDANQQIGILHPQVTAMADQCLGDRS